MFLVENPSQEKHQLVVAALLNSFINSQENYTFLNSLPWTGRLELFEYYLALLDWKLFTLCIYGLPSAEIHHDQQSSLGYSWTKHSNLQTPIYWSTRWPMILIEILSYYPTTNGWRKFFHVMNLPIIVYSNPPCLYFLHENLISYIFGLDFVKFLNMSTAAT